MKCYVIGKKAVLKVSNSNLYVWNCW